MGLRTEAPPAMAAVQQLAIGISPRVVQTSAKISGVRNAHTVGIIGNFQHPQDGPSTLESIISNALQFMDGTTLQLAPIGSNNTRIICTTSDLSASHLMCIPISHGTAAALKIPTTFTQSEVRQQIEAATV